MIISVCGPHAAGKSWIVQQVLDASEAKPVYGCLGPRRPEAYSCNAGRFFILGPYHIGAGTVGADNLVKLGTVRWLEFLESYISRGPVIFESALTAKRFAATGAWLCKNHSADTRIVRIDITKEAAAKNLHTRREKFGSGRVLSGQTDKRPNGKYWDSDWRQFEAAMRRYEEGGCHVELIKPNAAPERILSWLA